MEPSSAPEASSQTLNASTWSTGLRRPSVTKKHVRGAGGQRGLDPVVGRPAPARRRAEPGVAFAHRLALREQGGRPILGRETIGDQIGQYLAPTRAGDAEEEDKPKAFPKTCVTGIIGKKAPSSSDRPHLPPVRSARRQNLNNSFCACWRIQWSTNTNAVMASTMGTARGTTQGSCRPRAASSVVAGRARRPFFAFAGWWRWV
jgi:hypothetical protein